MILLQHILLSITITFFSMVIGIALNELIKKKEFYKSISEMEFIKSDSIYKLIGIKYIKWLVYKTFWKNINLKLTIRKKTSIIELNLLKQEMTNAEISHLIAFIIACLISVITIISKEIIFGIILIVTNVIFNLYPLLLQQKNKSRINKLIDKNKSYF